MNISKYPRAGVAALVALACMTGVSVTPAKAAENQYCLNRLMAYCTYYYAREGYATPYDCYEAMRDTCQYLRSRD